MAIGRIRRATRYLSRYREIFHVLVRYGLADWARRVDIDFVRGIITSRADPELLKLSTEQRVRHALMELGPTFIKFGQMLSMRPDLVGVPMSDELKKLLSHVEADPPETVRKIVAEELGRSPDEIFAEFDPEPVASASIGQVHKARLKPGEAVAVKVIHDGIEGIVERDLDIIRDLAGLVEDYVEEARYYKPRETVESFARTMTREMDFMREARNIINLAEDFADDETVKIPRVYEDYTTSRVLVMEWIDGIPLDTVDPETETRFDVSEAADKGAKIFLKMVFVNGFYHADPHPANIMIMDDGRIALLDYGMVGRLSLKMREYVEDGVSAVVRRDSERLAQIIIKAGSLPPDLDTTTLGADITDFISFYGSLPISKIKLFEALNEVVSIIHRHHIILPSEITMLIKTLATLEGSHRSLNPEFNLLSLIRPYQESMAWSALSPTRGLNRARRFYYELQDFVETVPSALMDIIERFRKETLEIHMEHRGMERSANRLTFGILTAAIFMGSSMVLSAGIPPLVFGFSLLGVIGYIVSLVMGLRILWAIMVSGRLD